MGMTSVSLRSHITRVQCQGQETSLAHCNYTTLDANDQLSHLERFMVAGVACAGQFKSAVFYESHCVIQCCTCELPHPHFPSSSS